MWRVLICICSGQRSSSAPAFHISLHGPRWAAWPPPPHALWHHQLQRYRRRRHGSFWFSIVCDEWSWWIFGKCVLMVYLSGSTFFIVDFDCWCFPLNVGKRTLCRGASPVAGPANRHGVHAEPKQWWRTPDPHFIDVSVMVAPVPRLVWAASLIKC